MTLVPAPIVARVNGGSTRRRLLGATGAALLSACAGGLAPTVSTSKRRVGMLYSGSAPVPSSDVMAAFHDGMKNESFVHEIDYVIDTRAAEGDYSRLLPLAQELVALGVDVIVANTTAPTQAARAATSSVPIVMVASHDPVDAGVVASLAHPGGNVTGQSLMGADLMPKQLEILSEAAPFRRLGYLTPYAASPAPGYPSVTDMFEAAMRERAKPFGIDVRTFTVRVPSDVDAALAMVVAQQVDALYVIESPFWFVELPSPPATKGQRPFDRVTQLARDRRLPSIAGLRPYAQQGLLMSYGDARTNLELFRGVTRFVARIFRGAKPADLPVERPTRFALTLNAKTAAAIGLTLPRTLLDKADAVIS